MLLVSSLQNGKAWQACAQQTDKKHSHTNSAVSRQVYVHALLIQHLQSVLFQHMIWYVPTSETVWMQRGQKNWWKSTDSAELKKINIRIYSNCSLYSSLFFKSFKFRYCSFCLIEKTLQITVQVCCLFYFLLLSRFFKGKVKSEIAGGFNGSFFKWAFKKKPGSFFWLVFFTTTLDATRVCSQAVTEKAKETLRAHLPL